MLHCDTMDLWLRGGAASKLMMGVLIIFDFRMTGQRIAQLRLQVSIASDRLATTLSGYQRSFRLVENCTRHFGDLVL